MEAVYCSIARDGEQLLVAVPEKKTLEFYQYLRGYGLCFTIECRGICEDNVFTFSEDENIALLRAVVGKFPLN
jgi:hypothetical protein